LKTLKEFVQSQKVEEPLQEEKSVEIEYLEAQEGTNLLELTAMSSDVSKKDPPAVLVMKRKAIRMFPNGERIALYYIDKLNKYVTVPYSVTDDDRGFKEEYIEESIIHHLNDIVTNHTAKPIKFKDGKTMKVDVQTANVVLNVHKALNDENKKKVADMAHKSKEHFSRVVDFAWKHSKFK
jgi:hypothetical protein